MISTDDLTTALNWRYATKQFDPAAKVGETEFEMLLEVLRLTPSSFGLQPWKFIVVRDAALREQLRPASWGQSQVTDASHLIVLAVMKKISVEYIDHFVAAIAQTRGVTAESLQGYRGMMVSSIAGKSEAETIQWACLQAYIALGFLMTAAALRGIDTCPMEGFERDKYDAILGLAPLGLTTAVVCPVGHRAATDKHAALAKVRFSRDELVIEK